MPGYTGAHRRPPSAAHRHARSNRTMSLIVGILIALVLGAAVFFAVRHGAVAFMNGNG